MRRSGAMAVVVLVAACSPGAASESTTTGAPEATSTSAATTTTGLTLSDLTGDWANESGTLQVNSGGEFLLVSGASEVSGFVARDGDEVNFVTSTSGDCPGDTGAYTVTIATDMLTLDLVDDPCSIRVEVFAVPLSPSP